MTTPAGELVRSRQPDFGAFVRDADALVVQPRMGFDSPVQMRAGLDATKSANATTVGTITLDSYTRVGDLDAIRTAFADGVSLNGYPIVSHERATTRWMLSDIWDADFPVQVRHGSAVPGDIFEGLIELGIGASEGGPVSYCLPYGRTSMADSVRNWAACSERFAELAAYGIEPHLETFGGCMMGQLCPPSQLVALSVLEALFFCQYGIRSISVSYAQQTSAAQDRDAVLALRRLCGELLPVWNWHVVVYAYMGLFPVTDAGAYRLLGQAAELAVRTGAERLIVKTVAESRRIPTVAENVAALEYASAVAAKTSDTTVAVSAPDRDSQTYQEASALVAAVLNLDGDVGRAMLRAFERGYLDIPYCLHPDNAGRTRSFIDDGGWLRWAELGALPLDGLVRQTGSRTVTSSSLLADLSFVRREFDRAPDPAPLVGPHAGAGLPPGRRLG